MRLNSAYTGSGVAPCVCFATELATFPSSVAGRPVLILKGVSSAPRFNPTSRVRLRESNCRTVEASGAGRPIRCRNAVAASGACFRTKRGRRPSGRDTGARVDMLRSCTGSLRRLGNPFEFSFGKLHRRGTGPDASTRCEWIRRDSEKATPLLACRVLLRAAHGGNWRLRALQSATQGKRHSYGEYKKRVHTRSDGPRCWKTHRAIPFVGSAPSQGRRLPSSKGYETRNCLVLRGCKKLCGSQVSKRTRDGAENNLARLESILALMSANCAKREGLPLKGLHCQILLLGLPQLRRNTW